MTAPQFSRPGAIDLSGLRNPATAPARPGSSGRGSYSFDVTGEQSLRADVVERSMSVVVLVSFWSDAAPGSAEINSVLTKLADEYAGRFLFARVDVGRQPELAEALGIPQVPLVVAALKGQLAPIIQEALPEADMRSVLDQVLEAAAASGVAGVVPPVADEPVAEAEALAQDLPPQHPAAEEALLAGDLDLAITEYEKALKAIPADDEATVGLARATLLRRTSGVDPAAARAAAAAAPDDVEAQTLVADLDLLDGHVEDAFGRLIDLVRRTSEAARDSARKHLIDMFAVVGDDDPRVGKARQMLANALF